MRTSTERGLCWLIVALGIALAADLAALGPAYIFYVGPVLGAGSPSFFLAAWDVLLFASVVPAALAFRALRRGRSEFGDGHVAEMRNGTAAFVGGAASAVLLLLTGLILGFAYVPSTAYAGTAGPSAPWTVFAGTLLRAAHSLAAPLLAVFLGLFLLEVLWSLSPRSSRVLVVVAFVAGVLVPLLGGVALLLLIPPIGTLPYLVLLTLPAISLGLWLGLSLLALLRVRGVRPDSATRVAPA